MTSPVASTILRRLGFAESVATGQRAAARLDFDSTLAFPDLPYDVGLPEARYPEPIRATLVAVVDAAYRVLDHVPAARDFVDAQLDTVLLRRSAAVGHATSSSNRTHVGVAVLTNLETSPDRVLVGAEALVHESVHQYLYRVEREHGPLCDLDATRRFRSPWSGNRIPLHSLVHACFVYQALLALWSRYATVVTDEADAAFARDRVARSLFGYGFVGRLIAQPTFPRAAVDPAILAAIGLVADTAAAVDDAVDGEPFGAAMAAPQGPWLDRITRGVAALDRPVTA
jgi:HEXXH motif-containing protein